MQIYHTTHRLNNSSTGTLTDHRTYNLSDITNEDRKWVHLTEKTKDIDDWYKYIYLYSKIISRVYETLWTTKSFVNNVISIIWDDKLYDVSKTFPHYSFAYVSRYRQTLFIYFDWVRKLKWLRRNSKPRMTLIIGVYEAAFYEQLKLLFSHFASCIPDKKHYCCV